MQQILAFWFSGVVFSSAKKRWDCADTSVFECSIICLSKGRSCLFCFVTCASRKCCTGGRVLKLDGVIEIW